MDTLDEADLIAFLDGLGRHAEATRRYETRMLRLIGRVDDFVARRDRRPANPAIAALLARPRFRFGDASSEDPTIEFLTAGQARQLVDYITGRQLSAHAQAQWTWKDLRDRAAVGVQLGAGATPGEARALKLNQIVIEGGRHSGEPWALDLPGNGNFPARQTPLAGWSGRLLARWLSARLDAGIPGDWVFPSTRTGNEWKKASSINAFREVLEVAGLPNPEGGSFRLRHTFALRQLTRHPPEKVAQWLGLKDPQMMERYRRVLYQPVEVV